MYPEKPKRGSDTDSQRTIDFVSPSPIEGCITILKRQAYDVWKDNFRVNLDSITPDEWVIQVFALSSSNRGGQKLVEGRLISHDSGGTQVRLDEVSAVGGAVLLILFSLVIMGVGVALAWTARGWACTPALIPIVIGVAVFVAGVLSLQNPRAKLILRDIERLLRR